MTNRKKYFGKQECVRCKELKKIEARGMCRICYSYFIAEKKRGREIVHMVENRDGKYLNEVECYFKSGV